MDADQSDSAGVSERDALLVYGASCTWWDFIDKADTLPVPGKAVQPGLRCCPHCHSVLFQVEEMKWWAGVDKMEKERPGYRAAIEWGRGQCFRTMGNLERTYRRWTIPRCDAMAPTWKDSWGDLHTQTQCDREEGHEGSHGGPDGMNGWHNWDGDAHAKIRTRDHWSLLLHIETRCVDYGGRLRGSLRIADQRRFDDLEEAGLAENVGTWHNPRWKMTDSGWAVAHRLRRHRASGAPLKDFKG